MRACACARKIGSGVAPVARLRSADIPVCGLTELSSSVCMCGERDWGLESPQDPQTGMSALRCSMRFMGDGAEQAHWHDQNDGQWQTPAFVLRGNLISAAKAVEV